MQRHSLTVLLAISMLTISTASAQQQSAVHRKVVSRVQPLYPELARRMQIQGIVKVEATVAANGKVKFTKVIGGSPVLTTAAVDAIERWKWVASPEETRELIELTFHSE